MLKTSMSKEYLLDGVSIDHDGTVADTRSAVTNEFNKRHGTNHLVTEMTHWNSVKDWCKEIGMSEKEVDAENFDLWYKPETVFKADPVSGSIEFLHELFMREKKFIIN